MGNTLPMYADIITCSEAQSLISMPPPPRESHLEDVAEEDNDETEPLRLRPTIELTYRPRILALHGTQSNNHVTKLQLANLRITEDDYDIQYLHGGIEVDEADPDLDGLINGPFYSWFDKNDSATLISAVHDVVDFCQTNGPFDGIYGFSTGAVVASLATNLPNDSELRDLLLDQPSPVRVRDVGFRGSVMLRQQSQRSQAFGRRQFREAAMKRQRFQKSEFGSFRNLRFAGLLSPEPVCLEQPLFKFVILACAPDISSARETAGYFQIRSRSILSSSFHIIGTEDAFKVQSEKNASYFVTREVMYTPGGHGVCRNVSLDKDLCGALRNFVRRLGRPMQRVRAPKYTQMNEVSGVHLLRDSQVALVQLNHELLPEERFPNGATIRGALVAQPSNKPFLYTSRNNNFDDVTTYGDLLNFINGGAGDLRALGVAPGEVVAYAASPGGSAMSAVAFLSIGAQTTAAPLAPNTAEPDALDALDQFGAKHLVLFDGVECPGVEAAFKKYAAEGNARLHRASAIGSEKPGLFEYTVNATSANNFREKPALMNSKDGTCLLIRTSGTTARPKGVPLSQGDLITNGAIIAYAMVCELNDQV